MNSIKELEKNIKENGYVIAYLDCRNINFKKINNNLEKYNIKSVTLKKYKFKNKIIMRLILYYKEKIIKLNSDNSMELYLQVNNLHVSDEARKRLYTEFEKSKK